MYCRYCGKKLPDDSLYCSKCGNYIGEDDDLDEDNDCDSDYDYDFESDDEDEDNVYESDDDNEDSDDEDSASESNSEYVLNSHKCPYCGSSDFKIYLCDEKYVDKYGNEVPANDFECQNCGARFYVANYLKEMPNHKCPYCCSENLELYLNEVCYTDRYGDEFSTTEFECKNCGGEIYVDNLFDDLRSHRCPYCGSRDYSVYMNDQDYTDKYGDTYNTIEFECNNCGGVFYVKK